MDPFREAMKSSDAYGNRIGEEASCPLHVPATSSIDDSQADCWSTSHHSHFRERPGWLTHFAMRAEGGYWKHVIVTPWDYL
jgi:hypothetical protein